MGLVTAVRRNEARSVVGLVVGRTVGVSGGGKDWMCVWWLEGLVTGLLVCLVVGRSGGGSGVGGVGW